MELLKKENQKIVIDYSIKVCGMKFRENIMDLVQLPIQYIGFIFYPPSPRYVGDDFNAEITNEIPDNVNKVGVFVDENLNTVLRKIEKYKLQFVQLHGYETPDYCIAIREKGCKIIKAFRAEPALLTCETANYRFACDYYLFDTPSVIHGGSGEKFDWKMLQQQKLYHTYFLSGGIAPGDERTIKSIGLSGLYALDLNSRFETAPGIKNVQAIKDFVKNLREKDNHY